MSYQKTMDKALRFGDVLKGFVLTSPSINDPFALSNYDIKISHPDYCVLLSPCCSIGDKVILLSPLIEVRNSFFNNSYFEEDLTRINRKMQPWQAFPQHIWENQLPEDERQRRLQEGVSYTLIDLFIYEKNELFKKYQVHMRNRDDIETNYYMIDFKNIFKVNCEGIKSAENAPINSKCLQLTIECRSELREKISYYFSRIPQEDKILED